MGIQKQLQKAANTSNLLIIKLLRYYIFLFFFFICINCSAQISYTANDTVPPYHGAFGYGINMGAYQGWTDDQLADIAIGNPDKNTRGVGINTLRPSLPENFVEEWGYAIRRNTFKHYNRLGATENTVFIGYPSQAHRDKIYYCEGAQSQMFDNLYREIWDDGANGTPINDDNWYALYVYKLVQEYHENVRFWEIWNEPDYAFVYAAELEPGEPGNWWDNDPNPCDYALYAPIQHYIRTLRISYEVIKYIDPDAYVAVGGLGFPSFLDAIMRNTDNPDEGKVSDLYPLRGGAYFDVLSYHTYPHIDGSLREWSNEISDFKYKRHSDEAIKGVLTKKYEFEDVLFDHGYNGDTYPEKIWIITEANIPRRALQLNFGSDEAQRNFTIKSIVECQKEDIKQLYFYQLGEIMGEDKARSEFDLMGMYKDLAGAKPYQQVKNHAGIALKTTYDELQGKVYDAAETERLNLPKTITGGAFRDEEGNYTYVLWVITTEDNTEYKNEIYEFSSRVEFNYIEAKAWDYSQTGRSTLMNPRFVELTGSPLFLTSTDKSPNATAVDLLNLSPNPFQDFLNVDFYLEEGGDVKLELLDATGRAIQYFSRGAVLPKGAHRIQLINTNLPNGVYFVRFESGRRVALRKLVLLR